MPQLSSTDRLIMAANHMSNALKDPHREVPFAQLGDDTIEALTKLAEIFKNKFQKVQTPGLSNAPAKAAGNKIPANLSHPILASPVHQQFQTISKTIINSKDTTNAPLLLRVVTPMMGWLAPPRVPMRSQNFSPRKLSQDNFWDVETANMAVALGTHHWSQQHYANAVVHPVTGKEMEYTALMKDPSLQPLWKRGFGNEVGRLFQGIRNIRGTDTCFFVELTNITKDRKITYGKIVCDYKPHKKEKEHVRLTVGGDRLDYSGDIATSTADITPFKIIINSTLSTAYAAMMMMDIKKYYLGTPLPRFEYMKMLLSCFPEEIVDKYNPGALVVDGWVHIEIRKGVYCKLVWHLLVITLLATHLDYGCTKQGQSLSPSYWTTLPSNMWASNTLIISEMLCYEVMS
jgi:hypothetical protein